MTTTSNSKALAELLSNKEWSAVASHFSQVPFAQRLGISVSLENPEEPKCSVAEIQEFHLGGINSDFVNGAFLSGIVDFALGLTALTRAGRMPFATASVSLDLAQPVRNGPFYAIGTCNQVIGRKLFSQVVIYDHEDCPCVFGTGTVITGIRQS